MGTVDHSSEVISPNNILTGSRNTDNNILEVEDTEEILKQAMIERKRIPQLFRDTEAKRELFWKRREEKRTEQNRTEQNRTEQNRTEQNRTEQKRREEKRREETKKGKKREEKKRKEKKREEKGRK